MVHTASSSSRSFAVVTGASSGIGFGIAAALAHRGFDLVMTSSDNEHLSQAAHRLTERFPELTISPVQADLSHVDGPQKLYDAVARMERPVDVLVNNAGVGVWGSFADGTNLKKKQAMVQLNATSPVQLTKKFLPGMIERGRGRLLFTASIASITATPMASVYGATKAFVYIFAEGLREEVEATGVTVTVLMPGPTATNWFHRAGAGATRIAQGPLADPADIAEDGVRAMLRGDDHIVTPFKSKMQATLGKLMPPPVLAHQGRLE